MDNNFKFQPPHESTEQSAPLTNHVYESMNIQRDEWEDKRNNKRLNQGTFTNIWLFIIAMYCLWEIIKDILPIIMGYGLIESLF